jgi:hypothetical protein
MRKIGLILITLFLGNLVFCQDGFFAGHIITNDNDTVFGEIKNKHVKFGDSGQLIKFKEANKKDAIYSPYDISEYRIYARGKYVTVDTPHGKGFGKIEVEGQLRLVYVEIYNSGKGGGQSFQRTNMSGEIITFGGTQGNSSISYRRHKIFRDGEEVFYVGKSTFKGRTANFFSDYPELQQEIIKKKLKYSDMKTIVKKYNAWYKEKSNNS